MAIRRILFGVVVVVVVVVVATLGAGAGSAQAADTAVEGRVTGSFDRPFMDVTVDLFTEDRETFLGSTTTSSDGTFRFDVEPGCYWVTAIAPEGFGFTLAPIPAFAPYWNVQTCATDGEVSDIGTRVLLRNDSRFGPAVEMTVTDGKGAPVPDVVIDLFAAGSAGERESYLFSRFTGPDGLSRAAFDVPGCYVLTFIAPVSRLFVESGEQWLNVPVCATVGETAVAAATVDSDGPTDTANIGGAVTDGDEPVVGLTVDLFTATGDGTRGRFLRDTDTGEDGRFGFETEAGCYVLTFIAPPNRTFIDTESPWSNRLVCVSAGENPAAIDAELVSA